MRTPSSIFALLTCVLGSSCSLTRQAAIINDSTHLKFLGEYIIPHNDRFKGTTIGGLSGIDYDPKKDIYYLISDDRSDYNPARFYEAKIIIGKNKIDSVFFVDVKYLKDMHSNFYPNSKSDPYHTPDPEALRYDPRKNIFVWSSEGERIVKANKIVLEDPAVTEIDTSGNYMDTFRLPPQLQMQATEKGPRQNGVFEGLTFANHYKTLFVNVEEPLYNDGPRAGLNDSTGITRILKFSMASKKPKEQYAYRIDPVAHAPIPSNAFEINGIPDILTVGKNKLMVLERSFSVGRMACTIKVFLADISSAENINKITSLKDNPNVKFATKKLLLNMDDLGIYIDNIEGVTFGPKLPDGKSSLLFISDNNFNPLQKTQFLLFEIE
jgi:hypothetical protein